ncbi:MAG: helix-turn-helix domain-containing protein [Oscillospiraceae bacterium]|nr:helix-turn-helix domain-containing protein [Oscillospiraceae bacterium]
MEQYRAPYRTGTGSALELSLCGFERNATLHGYGPFKRDHYLIHCVVEGCGFFEVGGTRYPVRSGEAFLIRPDESTFYIADKDDPWSYAWVGFSGSEAADILEMLGGGPILQCTDLTGAESCVRRLMRYLNTECNPFLLQSELYHFFSFFALASQSTRTSSPAAVAKAFFKQNHTYPITVEQAAAYAGVSRSHLFRLFRQAYGMAPQDYLCRLRLQHAAQLLQSGACVAEAAYSAGFSDLPHFSRRFRREYGTAPSRYAGTLPDAKSQEETKPDNTQ